MPLDLPALLRDHQLDPWADAILATALPSIRVHLGREPPPGGARTRFGGDPDLPPDAEWPARKNGKALDFLVQLDLAEVSPLDTEGALPRTGLLSFFYDRRKKPWGIGPADLDGHAVRYVPAGVAVERRSNPERPKARLPELGVKFSSGVSLPVGRTRGFGKLIDRAGDDHDTFFDRYLDVCWEVQRIGRTARVVHALLGHPMNIQGDMSELAVFATNGVKANGPRGFGSDAGRALLDAEADDWRLLLQLDSAEGAGMRWGDDGRIFFWIRRQDLAEGRFDRTYAALQTS